MLRESVPLSLFLGVKRERAHQWDRGRARAGSTSTSSALFMFSSLGREGLEAGRVETCAAAEDAMIRALQQELAQLKGHLGSAAAGMAAAAAGQ
eukprot:4382866-Amphidinium_carterae.1